MEKNKKIMFLSTLIVGIIVLSTGITYSLFTDSRTSKNSQLIAGDIYMHYSENNQINMSGVAPSNTYDPTKYFEFTIDGKNTTTNKDIWYEIDLQHGDDIEGKTRIKDNLLKFTLIEIKDGEEKIVVDNKSFDDLTNAKIWVNTINKNTTNEINITYRLYMWISSDTIIGNVDQDYTMEEWENVYASIKVNVNGDFNEKKLELETNFKKIVKEKQTDTCKTYIEEDGITYVSGSSDCIDFNYVWYSGKLWRITAINPDGTMKMITDDPITTISYGEDVNFYDVSKKDDASYTGSYIYQWLNEDFLDTLYNYENIIIEDSAWNITNSNTSSSSAISTKLPETTLIKNSTIGKNTPVGLLNSYEYYLSYKNTSNSSGYLKIGYYWWLLNSYSSSNVWNVRYDGYANPSNPSSTTAARPVVVLKSNIRLLGESGTKDNPYRISGDREQAIANTTLLNTRTVGEYVAFDEDGDTSTKELYRIVSIEDGKTKLNKNDYIKNGTTTLTKKFSKSITYGNGNSDDYWDYYLNNTWYNSLASINMLDKGTYYIKTRSSGSYKNSLCNTNNTTETIKNCVKTTSIWNTGYVGLPRYGEMFASQQGGGSSSSNDIWLITPSNSSNVWYATESGIANGNTAPSYTNAARPSIYLKSNVVITGGDGTKSNPFTISIQ